MRPSVIKIYIATLYSFNAYCIHRKVNRVRELTADGADRFVRWYLSTRRIRSGAGNSSNALRAYSWALSTQGIQVPDWRIHKAEATPAIVATYLRHAREQRGLSQCTLDRDRVELIKFFRDLAVIGGWKHVSLVHIDRYLHDLSRHMGHATVERTATAIRSWLRFLFASGHLKEDLSILVVAPVRRMYDTPPRALPWPQIRKMLRCIDTKSSIGARDRAQFLLMSAYGLGGAEVLQLQLPDIDWAARQLRVTRPKTKSTILLPLLPEVAHALATYIRRFRPRPTASRFVFLSQRVPYEPFSNSGVLRHRVKALAKKAGIHSRPLGTHVFRHSHATRHILIGTAPKILSDILGHRDADSTSIYTRSALHRLRCLALPVPI